MRIQTALAAFSIAALTLTGCGSSSETGTPKVPATETPDDTINNGDNTDNNNNNGDNTNPGNNPGDNTPTEFSPPRPGDIPADGCYKNFTMEWPAEGSNAFAQSVYDADGNEVQFRTFAATGQMYGESISTFNADGKQLTSQYTVQGSLDNRRENTYDAAGFMNSQSRDETGDGLWNYIWTSVNHAADGATQGKRETLTVDTDGDGVTDAKGTYSYNHSTGRLTSLDWDGRDNGKVNTIYAITNVDSHDGYTQTWKGQTQFHASNVANTYVEANGEQKLSTSVSTYADGTIDVSTSNTYVDGSLTTIDVDIGGTGTVDYQWVTTGTNSMGNVTSREREVGGVPYAKTVFGYVPGKDLINTVVNYEINKYNATGTSTWQMTDSTSLVYNENDKVIRETEETFDDDNNSTGRSETLYTYNAEGDLTMMTYDDLEHGDSLLEAVYTYTNWTADGAGNKTADLAITRLTNCSTELAYSEGTETYDSEDNMLSASYTAHSNPTANCEGWFNYEEQTEMNADENPLVIRYDYYGNDSDSWEKIETYTWLDAERYSTYEEDTNGDGTAETRQEITYDAGGRFDTYKVDGNDDGDADGEWDFLLLPATECLQ